MAKNKQSKRNASSGGLNTNYLTKMGAHNLIANRSMSFSSISVLTACLLLIGISIVILLNIQTLVKDVEKQNVVVAFVEDGIDDAAVQKVGTDLKLIPNIVAVEFVSKEQGYEEQLKEFGVEKDLFDDVINNPLPHSYRISVSNLEEFNVTLEQIKAVENVNTVRESQELVNQISVIQKSITAICMIIVIVLAFVSMFIIANTIRITMVSRKIDIQVMRSVGATNMFICWPFLIEGIIIGLISGLLSLGLTVLVQYIEGDSLTSLMGLFGSEAIAITDHLPLLIVTYILAGVTISTFGSLASIRKYLKKEGSEANDI